MDKVTLLAKLKIVVSSRFIENAIAYVAVVNVEVVGYFSLYRDDIDM